MPVELQTSTVERTLRLVELLLAQPDGLSPQELMFQAGLPRSSLFQLLNTLKKLGYLEQAEKRGRYRLGPRIQSWRTIQPSYSKDLLSIFYQETARTAWQETLALVLPTHAGPVVLAQAEGCHQVRSVFISGQAYPGLAVAASGLDANPAPDVRANGFALAVGDESLELVLPICKDGRYPTAALLLSAPAFRWQPEPFLAAFLSDLRVMAARFSYQLGAPFYAPYTGQYETQFKITTELSTDEIANFLNGPWTARLACIRPDGGPHVIPVWQEWDGEKFVVIAWQGSQWAEYVLQNPNVSLSVDEPWPPLRRVVARGQAVHMPADSAMLGEILSRLAGRYLGQGTAGITGQVQIAFSILPDYLRGWQGLPGTLISV